MSLSLQILTHFCMAIISHLFWKFSNLNIKHYQSAWKPQGESCFKSVRWHETWSLYVCLVTWPSHSASRQDSISAFTIFSLLWFYFSGKSNCLFTILVMPSRKSSCIVFSFFKGNLCSRAVILSYLIITFCINASCMKNFINDVVLTLSPNGDSQ